MEKTFYAQNRKASGIIVSALLGLLFASIIFAFGIYATTELLKLDVKLGLIISAILALIFAVLFIVLRTKKHEYTVSDKAVTVRVNDKVKHNFAFDEYSLSSRVVKNYYNGIYTGSTRYLVVENNIDKTKDVLCKMSKENFDEFMTLITNYSHPERFNSNEGVNGKAERPNISQSFSSDTSRVFKTTFKQGVVWIIIVSVLIAFVAFGLYSSIKSKGDSKSLLTGVIILAIAAICAFLVMYSLFVLAKSNRIKSKTPERIAIDKDSISVDSNVYFYDYITSLSMTPPSYTTGGRRTLKIKLQDGSNSLYEIDYQTGKDRNSIFADYSQIYDLIERMLLNEPGKFMLDL